VHKDQLHGFVVKLCSDEQLDKAIAAAQQHVANCEACQDQTGEQKQCKTHGQQTQSFAPSHTEPIRKITDALSKEAHEARQDKQRASRDPLWVFDDAAGALANIAGALVDDPHLHPDDRSAIEQDHYQLRNWEF
jgi:hypothetical protein